MLITKLHAFWIALAFAFLAQSSIANSSPKKAKSELKETTSAPIPGTEERLNIEFPATWNQRIIFGALNLFPTAANEETEMPYVLVNVGFKKSPDQRNPEEEIAHQKAIYVDHDGKTEVQKVETIKLKSGEIVTKMLIQQKKVPEFYLGNEMSKMKGQTPGLVTYLFFFRRNTMITVRATVPDSSRFQHGDTVNAILNSFRTGKK